MGQTALFDVGNTPEKATKPHQQAVDGWTRFWRETRGEEWAWSPVDLRHIRNTLKFRSGGSADLLLDRARRLLTDAPTAWLAQNASPAVLYSYWNQLTFKVAPMNRDARNLSALARAAREL